MKKAYLGFVMVVTLVMAMGGIVTVANGKKEYSENENRYLTRFPHPDGKEILSGKMQEEITDAFNDQFPNRDFWTSISTEVEKTMGKQEIGGVYLGKDHYYFEKIGNQDISQTNYFQNLRFIKYIAAQQEQAEVTTMLVPSPGSVLKDKLPQHAPLFDSDKLFREAQELLEGEGTLLDLRPVLKKIGKNKQIYFKTDHHWSLRGAHAGYQAYMESLGEKAKSYEDFAVQVISDSFYGTLYSKALDSRAVPDELDAVALTSRVRVSCDGQERDTIYDDSKRDTKDKYAYFFGGNYGEVQIENQDWGKASERKLLVIKDSFANSLVPFFIEDYSQICMLDLRYYKGSVKELIESYGADEILVLYEISNFAQDTNLNKLTK